MAVPNSKKCGNSGGLAHFCQICIIYFVGHYVSAILLSRMRNLHYNRKKKINVLELPDSEKKF